MSVLNTQQIQEILPHRYPMLMLDTVEELVPGEKTVAIKMSPSTKKSSKVTFQAIQHFLGR